MSIFKEIEFGESSAENEAARHPNLVTEGYYGGTNWVDIALNSDKFLFFRL